MRLSSSAACAHARITPAASAISPRRSVRPELECAGVQAQQRDAVREHVVHLARDAVATSLALWMTLPIAVGFWRVARSDVR
jgi:hypothetical protein